MYLFGGGKGMFSCFYVKKIVPVDMAPTDFGLQSVRNFASDGKISIHRWDA
jgi:hypothetical protein